MIETKLKDLEYLQSFDNLGEKLTLIDQRMEEIYSFYNKYASSLLNGEGDFLSDDESSDLLQKSSRTSEG